MKYIFITGCLFLLLYSCFNYRIFLNSINYGDILCDLVSMKYSRKWKYFLGTIQIILRKKYVKLRKNKTFDEKNYQIFAEMQLSANLFPLESSIQKHSGSRGAVPVVDAGGAKPPAHKKINSTNFPQKKFLEIFFS